MSRHETIADIAAEMRSMSYYIVWTKDKLAEVADRMEAAHERELAEAMGRCLNGNGTCPDGNVQKTLHETPDSAKKSQESPSDARLVTAELRECVRTAAKTYDSTPWHMMDGERPEDHEWCSIKTGELLAIADRIDEEHSRRMCQSGNSLRTQNRRYRTEIARLRHEHKEAASYLRDRLADLRDAIDVAVRTYEEAMRIE